MVEASRPPEDDLSNSAIYSGSGPDERDPKLLNEVLSELVIPGSSRESSSRPVPQPEVLRAHMDDLRRKRAHLIERKNAGDASAVRELIDVMDELIKVEADYAALKAPDTEPE